MAAGSDEIDARALLRASIRSVEDVTRTRAVLPFFGHDLEVRFLLVVLRDGACIVTPDLPQHTARRVLHYTFPPRLGQRLEQTSVHVIEPLLHFDPWWLMRDREDLPPMIVDAVVATNLPGRTLAAGQLRGIVYDGSLSRVVAAKFAGSPRLEGDELLGVFHS